MKHLSQPAGTELPSGITVPLGRKERDLTAGTRSALLIVFGLTGRGEPGATSSRFQRPRPLLIPSSPELSGFSWPQGTDPGGSSLPTARVARTALLPLRVAFLGSYFCLLAPGTSPNGCISRIPQLLLLSRTTVHHRGVLPVPIALGSHALGPHALGPFWLCAQMSLIPACLDLLAQTELPWRGLGLGTTLAASALGHLWFYYIPRLGGAPACRVGMDSQLFCL